jgi:hypothetical protein
MKKEIYDRADLELVKFITTNVLVNSPDPKSDDEDELPVVPGNSN